MDIIPDEPESSFISWTRPGADAVLINKSVRSHWGIGNSHHWTLDVAFGEGRKRDGNAAQNFSRLNRIALGLPKRQVRQSRSEMEKAESRMGH